MENIHAFLLYHVNILAIHFNTDAINVASSKWIKIFTKRVVFELIKIPSKFSHEDIENIYLVHTCEFLDSEQFNFFCSSTNGDGSRFVSNTFQIVLCVLIHWSEQIDWFICSSLFSQSQNQFRMWITTVLCNLKQFCWNYHYQRWRSFGNQLASNAANFTAIVDTCQIE